MTHPFTDAAAEEFRKMEPGNNVTLEAVLSDFKSILAEHREKVIRECIEALPGVPDVRDGLRGSDQLHGAALALGTSRRLLESLLPKPDRAKELVREWIKFDPVPYSPDEAALRFARWLLTEKGVQIL